MNAATLVGWMLMLAVAVGMVGIGVKIFSELIMEEDE